MKPNGVWIRDPLMLHGDWGLSLIHTLVVWGPSRGSLCHRTLPIPSVPNCMFLGQGSWPEVRYNKASVAMMERTKGLGAEMTLESTAFMWTLLCKPMRSLRGNSLSHSHLSAGPTESPNNDYVGRHGDSWSTGH